MSPIRPQLAVLVGRFQPFHNAHLALLQHALTLAPRCVVVIASAHQARTPKTPFTWAERAEMIRLALTDEQRERVQFLPVRNHYDESRWVKSVKAGVAALHPDVQGADITLVGHFKDATSAYLRRFAGWSLTAVARQPGISGTQLRDVYYAASDDELPAALSALVSQAPASTLAFLRAWAMLPFRAAMTQEWRMLRDYHAAWACAPYPPVFVTVDAVVRCAGHVLLIQRGMAPGRGLWAVPGGFIEQRETVYQSCVRELAEETHLHLLDDTLRQCLRATAVFDHPDRSQRGRIITHAHFFDLGERELPEVRADDDAQAVAWVPMAQLSAMEDQFHDDHFHMLDHFLGLTGAPASS